MIVPRSEIRGILRGQVDELHLQMEKPPKIGSVQAVQSGVGKKAKCSVRVLDSWPHRDGGHMIRFEVAARPVSTLYLRPKGGYTDDPNMALRDENGAEWAVPAGWRDPGVAVREQYRKQQRSDEYNRLSLGGQLDRLLAEARSSRMDVHDRANKIRRELELLEKDLEDRAA